MTASCASPASCQESSADAELSRQVRVGLTERSERRQLRSEIAELFSENQLQDISAICPARTKFRMAVQDYDTLAKRRDKASFFWRNRVCGFMMKVALV